LPSYARSGLSLIEMVTAVLIFCFLIGSFWHVFMQSRTIITIGMHDTEALNIAASFFSQARHLRNISKFPNESSRAIKPSNAIQLPLNKKIDLPDWNPQIFTVKFEMKNFPGTLFRPAKLLTLQIEWKENLGKTHVYDFPVLCVDE